MMKKLVSVGILGLLLIIGNISATCLTLDNNVSNDNNSEKSTMNCCTLSSNPQPPETSLFFDYETGMVTLIAADLPDGPSGECCGVKATYYIIDDGEQQIYTEPFFIGEGTHTVKYWSEDNCGNVEMHKTATFTFDITPPTVELTSPEEGKLYLFGTPIMKRIIDSGTLCIGKVPVAANANDGDGTSVSMVMFSFSNGDTGYDDDGSNGFTYTFNGMHFGVLTITAVAIDNVGLTSTPDSMTVNVYNLGLI
jgi:hypothetical protein